MPAGVMARIRLLTESVTYTVQLLETATAEGYKKLALVPRPSLKLADPEPARVDTTPAGVMARIRLLTESVTYTVPLLETATPEG